MNQSGRGTFAIEKDVRVISPKERGRWAMSSRHELGGSISQKGPTVTPMIRFKVNYWVFKETKLFVLYRLSDVPRWMHHEALKDSRVWCRSPLGSHLLDMWQKYSEVTRLGVLLEVRHCPFHGLNLRKYNESLDWLLWIWGLRGVELMRYLWDTLAKNLGTPGLMTKVTKRGPSSQLGRALALPTGVLHTMCVGC